MEKSFYSEEELKSFGLKLYGRNVFISRKCSIYGSSDIVLGSNVRIDDFCILSGKIKIGDYVHIAAYSALYAGNAGIEIEDFANISSRVAVYAVSDDYSGNSMTNPMVPVAYKNLEEKKVIIRKHVIIGTGCTVLPGAEISEGSAVGCMSLVKDNTEPWTMYAGIPIKKLKMRSKELLNMERKFFRGGYFAVTNGVKLFCIRENKRRYSAVY